MTNNTFDRFEDKYIINHEQYFQLKHELNFYGEIDPYGRYPISSIYFDNAEHALANCALNSPKNNKKLRLRKYNHAPFESADLVMYELKERKDGRILKVRSSLKFQDFNNIYNLLKTNSHDSQFLHILNDFCICHELSPKILVKYYREAYQFREVSDLRITFDSQIQCCSLDFLDTTNSLRHYCDLIPETDYLLEIKYDSETPDWLKQLLKKYQIIQTDFSKFLCAHHILSI